ncbi:hypothetical protein DFH06DRAFT_1128084 [Mycena polygramma]|nr:hypothetical protein DFH06DRAFT_1128084 [Mycena polygramma]
MQVQPSSNGLPQGKNEACSGRSATATEIETGCTFCDAPEMTFALATMLDFAALSGAHDPLPVRSARSASAQREIRWKGNDVRCCVSWYRITDQKKIMKRPTVIPAAGIEPTSLPRGNSRTWEFLGVRTHVTKSERGGKSRNPEKDAIAANDTMGESYTKELGWVPRCVWRNIRMCGVHPFCSKQSGYAFNGCHWDSNPYLLLTSNLSAVDRVQFMGRKRSILIYEGSG